MLAAAGLAACEGALAAGAGAAGFRLRYVLASCMYGTAPLAEILPEAPKTGASHIEIWAKRHGNQREQIDEMGEQAFLDLLARHQVKLGGFTCFKYGIFKMREEMRMIRRLGGDLAICNSGGPGMLQGEALRDAVSAFAEKLKPEVELAESLGVTIGVENHGNSLINTPESQLQLLEKIPSKHLGIALACYHMPQDAALIAEHVRALQDRLVHFQAWQHGMGCMEKLPKEQELLQLPGRGDLDFQPILQALRDINYPGRTQIFMHPVPRGVPILPTTQEVTREINRSRQYLDALAAGL